MSEIHERVEVNGVVGCTCGWRDTGFHGFRIEDHLAVYNKDQAKKKNQLREVATNTKGKEIGRASCRERV